MKHIKKIFYLLAILVTSVFLLLMGTAIAQLIMIAVSEKMGIAISDDFLYHVSGNIGTAIAGIVLAIHVKKRKYIQRTEAAEPFRPIKALIFMGISLCICRIITDVVTALLLSGSFSMHENQSLTNTTWVDLLFTVIIAPVFEELLFRMGIYNLLLQKFNRLSSMLICSILFAVVHGYQLQGFISCLIAGLVFTLIYAKTGNILYCISAHGICNLFPTIMNALSLLQ